MSGRIRLEEELRGYYMTVPSAQPETIDLRAVLEVTSGIRPRPRWLARLAEAAAALAPRPGVARALELAAAAAVLVVAAVLIASVGRARPSTSFEGRWEATDDDGSSMVLEVGVGDTPTVLYLDQFASVCERAGDAQTVYTATGKGRIDGNWLTVRFDGGGCDTYQEQPFELLYARDPASDTLNDGSVTWRRAP
jgi:hypothetical protein